MHRLLLTLALLGCGDGIKSALFQGEPAFIVDGVLSENQALRPSPDSVLRYALFWNVGALNLETGVFYEDRATTQIFDPPRRFVMPIYEPPRELGPPGYSLGFLLVYDDRNANGHRDPDEPFTGGATSTLISYAPGPTDIERSIVRVAIKPGYDVLASPLRCQIRDYPLAGNRCDIPVGDPCFSNDDCDPRATCVDSVFASRLPGGMCIVTETDPNVVNAGVPEGEPCAAGARYLPVLNGSWLRKIGEGVTGIWLPACTTDADCDRPGFHCAQGGGVCLPRPTFDVVVDTLQQLPPLCIVDFRNRSRGGDDSEAPDDPEVR